MTGSMAASLSAHDITVTFASIGVLIFSARLLGEITKRLGQPAVLGEILAGVFWGPTLMGRLAPGFHETLFPAGGSPALILSGIATVSMALFLMVAGLEVDLSTIWKQGRAALVVSLAGIVFPFATGFSVAQFHPTFFGGGVSTTTWVFPLFFATALSISALPVIARTLMDLNLYRSDLGMLVVAAAIVDDLLGWIIFSVLLGAIGVGHAHSWSLGGTVAMTLTFAVAMLTFGRWLLNRILPWLQAHTTWPSGVLAFSLALGLFGAAFTEWIGVHAVFGAFLTGVALGDSVHLRERTRSIMEQFIASIFAPVFFASIGLKIDFIAHFDWLLVVVVVLIACFGKVIGCGLGALASGMPKREAWALGFAMNARGAMEIILGLLALEHQVIDERMFVALVVMALVTSMMSGPLMQRILNLKKTRRFTDHVSPKAFVARLRAVDRKSAIEELTKALGKVAGHSPEQISEAVWERESIAPTGLGRGLAVPHARLENLQKPMVAVGVSTAGVDFDAADGRPAQLIFLILTPTRDDGAQIEILGDIARCFGISGVLEKAIASANYTEFLAVLSTERVAA